MRIAILVSAVSCALVGLAMADPAAAAIRVMTNIGPQDLSGALRTLAADRHLQILYTTHSVENRRSGGAVGEFTADEALSRILGGTGLAFRYIDETTIAVVPVTEAGAQSNLTTTTGSGAGESPTGRSVSPRLHLAQAGQSSLPEQNEAGGPRSATEKSDESGASQNRVELEQVVVTGSRIRGHDNPVAQVTVISAKDIEDQGFASIDDVFRSIPQISGSGSMQAMQINNQVPSGSNGSSSINLGGFGADSTLVLINGRRTANSAIMYGNTVNVSTIPTSAIERIEVLPAAAAAIYGADAVAGVVNIILKKRSAFEANTKVDYENSSTGGDATQLSQDLSFGWGSGRFTGVVTYRKSDQVTADSLNFTTQDFRSRGGYDLRSQYLGQTGSIAGFGSLAPGNPGTAFTAADVSTANFVPTSNIYQDLVPQVKDTSVYINAEQQVTARVRLFVDALYSKNDADNWENPYSVYGAAVPASNAFNPYGSTVYSTYLFDTERAAGLMPSVFRGSDDRVWQGTFGADVSLPHDWQLEIYGTRSQEENLGTYTEINTADPAVIAALADTNPQTALNLFGNGTVQNATTLKNIISYWQGRTDNKIMSVMTQFSAQANGVLFSLPTGAVKASFVAEWRKDSLDWAGFGAGQPKGSRSSDAVGTEFSVPLLNRAVTGQQLDLTLAARWDRYTASGDFNADGSDDHFNAFSATTPMAGLAWKPIQDLRLRGSWNKAFPAPVIHDIAGLPYPYQTTVYDPLAPGGPKNVAVNVTWPASSNLGPEKAKVWTAGVDWQHLDSFGGSTSASLTYTNTDFTNRIQGAYIYFNQDPGYFVSHPAIFPGTSQRDAAGNLTNVYLTNINVASDESQVLNLDAKYDFTAATQHFSLGASLAYTPKFEEQVSANAATTNLAGTFRGPDRFRGIVRASWNSPEKVWGANVFVRASSSYSNTIPSYAILEPPAGAGAQISERVAGYTTVDLTGSYQCRGPGAWLDGLTITAGARNLFDKSFPLIDLNYGPVLPFDPSRVDVRGRVVFLEVGKRFH